MYMQGQILIAQGRLEEGMAQMRQASTDLRTRGQILAWPSHATGLAKVYGTLGQVDTGLSLLSEALTTADKHGLRYCMADTYRLRGELLLQRAVPDASEAEACFQQALAIARQQQAKSWELRAAMSLSRLWQQQGKRAEAYTLLAPLYAWFTEGFDTADLQEAKALLEELS